MPTMKSAKLHLAQSQKDYEVYVFPLKKEYREKSAICDLTGKENGKHLGRQAREIYDSKRQNY